jgi:dinuclear metal center YbgI/SA1388 family protein
VSTVAQLLGHLDGAIPFEWAEAWDRVGLLVGDPSAEVRGVLVSLDATPDVVERALRAGANVLVTHHPAFLDPLEAVLAAPGPTATVFAAASRGVALVACHTNLDRSPEGADALPARLGLVCLSALERRDPADRPGTPLAGRLCDPGGARTLGTLAGLVGSRLGVGTRVWGDPARAISVVALAPGSGRSMVEDAIAAGADALVTGELRYHVAHEALDRGLAIVEAGHDATEWPLTRALSRIVRQAPGLAASAVVDDELSYPWQMVAKGSECT